MNTEPPIPPPPDNVCPPVRPPMPAGGEPLFWGMKFNLFNMMMYFACFAWFVVPVAGVILPIVMWATNKDRDASGMIDRHGKNILNFVISMAIYGVAVVILAVASFGILGFVLGPAWAVYGIVVIIKGAVAANEGQYWPIPYCIRFFT